VSVSLLCLPFAGAGATFYSPWRKLAPPELSVHPLQLPGREWRISETPRSDLHELADLLASEVASEFPRTAALALFGHSLGAVLAYELARRLLASGRGLAGLFVSGSPAPGSPRTVRATGLQDAQFIAEIERFAGYRHAALDNPELRELLLPTLRTDVEMHENYRPRGGVPIDVPVTSLRGASDTLVGAEESAGWAQVTSASYRQVELAGGHMYLVESAKAVLELVGNTLHRAAQAQLGSP
jgi:surfactin synthase thioesterase subunit